MAAFIATILALTPVPGRAASPPAAPRDSAAVSVPVEPDTSLTPEGEAIPSGADVVSDSAGTLSRAPRRLRQTARFDQPRWVMLRSLVIPGWGQAHNHAWIKAALLAAGDGVLRVRMVRDEQRLNTLNRDASRRLDGLKQAASDTTAAGQAYAEAVASGDQQRIDAAFAARAASYAAVRSASDAYNAAAEIYNVLLGTATNRRWIAAGVVAYALLDAYIDAHFRYFDLDFQLDPALPGDQKPAGARLRIGWRF